jgi:hypothetical protein
MKPVTEKQRQWLWFVGLSVAGLSGALLLAYATRWFLKMI